jgi:glycosyltransferase involved in cell wall biosynthesis
MNKFSYDLMKNTNIDVDGMIYNIVDTKTFKPLNKGQLNKERLMKLNPAIKNKKIMLYVCRPIWRKNIEFLLGAFKEITRVRDDVMLYLHVDFNDEGVPEKPNIHKLLHSLSLQKRVMYTEENRWTKGIPAEFLNRLYNMCDLYVAPHGGEGFGLPIAEAMACGVPFVATDCTSMPEFAGNDERGLLAKVSSSSQEKGVFRPWVDINDFIEKITYLLDNDDVRKKMGRRGVYWVRKNCSKNKIIPQWKKVFDSLDVPLADVDFRATTIQWSDKYVHAEVENID